MSLASSVIDKTSVEINATTTYLYKLAKDTSTPRCMEGHYSIPWIAPLYP